MFEGLTKAVNEKFGNNTVRQALGMPNETVVSTGIFPLDYALSGGIQENKLALFVGWEASGKTTTAYRTLANALEKYPEDGAVIVDTENTFDPIWADKLGMDLDRCYVVHPRSAQNAIDIAVASIQEPQNKFLLIDSLAMFTPEEVLNASASDTTQLGKEARLNSAFLNVLMVNMVERSKSTSNPIAIVVINQYTNKIGITYGDNRSIAGGNKQRFAATTIIDFGMPGKEIEVNSKKDKKEKTEEDENSLVIANTIKLTEFNFTVKKFRGDKVKSGEYEMAKEAHPDLDTGHIDDYKTTISTARKHGLVKGGANKFTIAGIEGYFKNQEEMRVYLIQNPLDYMDLKARVIACRRHILGLPTLPPDNYLMRYQVDENDLEVEKSVATEQEGQGSSEIPSTETLAETGENMG